MQTLALPSLKKATFFEKSWGTKIPRGDFCRDFQSFWLAKTEKYYFFPVKKCPRCVADGVGGRAEGPPTKREPWAGAHSGNLKDPRTRNGNGSSFSRFHSRQTFLVKPSLIKPSSQTSWSNPPSQPLMVEPSWSNPPVKPHGRTFLVKHFWPNPPVKPYWSNPPIKPPGRTLLVKLSWSNPAGRIFLVKSSRPDPGLAPHGQTLLVKPSRPDYRPNYPSGQTLPSNLLVEITPARDPNQLLLSFQAMFLAILSGYPCWRSFLSILSGYLSWRSFLAILSGYPFWQSFLAIPSGYPFGLSFLDILSGDPVWPSFLAILSNYPFWLSFSGDPFWLSFLAILSGYPL